MSLHRYFKKKTGSTIGSLPYELPTDVWIAFFWFTKQSLIDAWCPELTRHMMSAYTAVDREFDLHSSQPVSHVELRISCRHSPGYARTNMILQ